MIEKWQRDCRPTKPSYSSRHPAPIEPDRLSFALRVTAVNPFTGYRSQPEQGLSRYPPSRFPRSVAAIACQLFYHFHTMSEKPPKQQRGLEGNYWVGADTSVITRGHREKAYHRWVRQRPIQTRSGHAIPKYQKVNYANSKGRTPAGDRCKSYI